MIDSTIERGIRKASLMIIDHDLNAIKKSVYGASELKDVQILEIFKDCVKSKIDFLSLKF
jgi:hypothetical protein